ncbi:MAG TPA: hypothetical protein VGV40_02105 [Solirubrobacteraceae bacterium]|nr:hypothetical protein [Solirubrobacteraceae bacterium]
MGDQQAPGGEDLGRSLGAKAISTTVRDNSTAFGFSITITVSFGLVQGARGSPTPTDILAFGLAAALAVAIVVGVVTRGFRVRAGHAPAEVRMLGTSLDFVSVGAAIGTVYGLAKILPGFLAWPVSTFAGVLVFLTLQSLEILLAEVIQRHRGDPDA